MHLSPNLECGGTSRQYYLTWYEVSRLSWSPSAFPLSAVPHSSISSILFSLSCPPILLLLLASRRQPRFCGISHGAYYQGFTFVRRQKWPCCLLLSPVFLSLWVWSCHFLTLGFNTTQQHTSGQAQPAYPFTCLLMLVSQFILVVIVPACKCTYTYVQNRNNVQFFDDWLMLLLLLDTGSPSTSIGSRIRGVAQDLSARGGVLDAQCLTPFSSAGNVPPVNP